jgi:hypothetical protein
MINNNEDNAELIRSVVKETIKVIESGHVQCAITTYDRSVVECTKIRIIKNIKEHFNYKERFPDFD